MKQFFGMSRSGSLEEALSGLLNPQFIMLLSNSHPFETHDKTLEHLFPGVPSTGCIGMSASIVENGVGVIASDTDRANYILGSLNGRPAKQVYKNILHVSDEEILTRTFQNPFGKVNSDDTCINLYQGRQQKRPGLLPSAQRL